MLRSVWRAETGYFLGLWLLLMHAGQSRFLRDPGTFWHAVVGHRILVTGQPITADPFSFTFAGRPWLSAQYWLAECAMALLETLGGYDAFVLVTAALLTLPFALVAGRLRREGFHWLVALPLVVMLFFASCYHFHARPHLVSIVFLAVVYGRLCDVEAGRLPLKQLFGLLPLFVLWVNMHGGVLGGMGTVVLAAAGWSLCWLLGRSSPVTRGRQWLLLAGFVVACLLTAFINPAGAELPRVWLGILRSAVVAGYVEEHKPLDPHDASGRAVLLLAGIYATALAATGMRRVRVTWLLPLVWFVLALSRVRHGPLFAVVAALGLADLLPHTFCGMWLRQHAPNLFRPPEESATKTERCWTAWLLPAAVVLTGLTLQATGTAASFLGRGWAYLDNERWPVELVPELPSLPTGTPVFNEMGNGGFLIKYAPNVRVFIDDRCDLYTEPFLQRYFEAEVNDPAAVEAWADDSEQGFAWAMTQSGSRFDVYLQSSPRWEAVAQAPAANLYRKKSVAASQRGPGL